MFIHQGFLNDLSLCDGLIDYHSVSETKPGIVGRKEHGEVKAIVDTAIKDSMDCVLNPSDAIAQAYIQQLQVLVEEYIKEYKFCNAQAPWRILETINIQHYQPGGGYKTWHAERANGQGFNAARHLVFMTYLNDVTDAGETEFFYQKLKVEPRKGLTIIWPADWTFTHRGIPSPTQEKYIITGWFSFTE